MIHICEIYRIWFSLVLWHISHCRLFNTNFFFIHICEIYEIWFGLVLWHISHSKLFKAKFFLYIYVKYIGFGLVWFYGISAIVGCLIRIISLYIYVKYIRFGLVLWHISHSKLFKAKFFLYIYVKYIRFGLVWFYDISVIVGHFIPNRFYTYIKYTISKHICRLDFKKAWVHFFAHS